MSSIPPVVPEGTRVTLSSMPDDFHHHFRDGEVCADVLRHASVRFGRAIAMPNLKVGQEGRGAHLGGSAQGGRSLAFVWDVAMDSSATT